LVEKENQLGGFAKRLSKEVAGKSIRTLAEEMATKVSSHPKIDLRLGVKVKHVEGSVGNFKTVLSDGNEIEHGVVIIATGAKPYVPSGRYAFGYGKDPRVKTLLEIDEWLERQEPRLRDLKQVVFIQCVGSRNEEHPYCSRVCCTHTMEQIIRLKELNPELQVFVLYRDIRTFGEKELLYQKARELGALFIRYHQDDPPLVQTNGTLSVRVKDHILNRELALCPDLLILANGIVPDEASKELAQFYKCATTAEGFMLEAHLKLRPVDFATDGVFMAGLCHYPKFAEESLAQALAAAARAATILSREDLPAESLVAEVDPRKCTACGQCVALCPYHAPRLEEMRPFGLVSVINPSLCKGCGNCAAACRCGAIQVKNLGEEPIVAAVEAAFGRLWY
jgi:heterodisulfide reductase subunit A